MRRFVLLISLLTSVWVLPCVSGQDHFPRAFSTATNNTAPPVGLRGRGVKRIRAVIVNARLFNNPETRPMTLMNFFPDINLFIDWQNVERVNNPAGLLWTGHVRGLAGSQATLVLSGKNVNGNITRGDGLLYEIRTTEDGRQWVREVDQKDFPRESEPLNPN